MEPEVAGRRALEQLSAGRESKLGGAEVAGFVRGLLYLLNRPKNLFCHLGSAIRYRG